MRLVAFLLVVVLAMSGLVAVALGLPERPGGHGFTHPEFSTMERGGPGELRHERVLTLGWAFGLAQIVFFTGLLALGARTREGLRGLGPGLVAGGLAYALVWTALVLAYRSYAGGSASAYFLGFPAPTALMLFALFPAPVIFSLLYVVGFERWIAAPSDIAELERRLAELRASDEDRS
ncbi:MAG: hypothetical protein V3V67_19025 [Myxococcota bacterium]